MTDKALVYLGVGSNIDRERHITAALDILSEEFGGLAASSVYESEAVGFNGTNFLNMVVELRTSLAVGALSARLKQIEADHGRRRNAPKFAARTLDLDMLVYDDLIGTIAGVQLPRAEILYNAFVLLPLSEVAPDRRHPQTRKSYRELWQEYHNEQTLWPVPFTWQGKIISPRR
ncbi:MAG: 2-amino-4-hydroxy-6-hydroxymethyldihydropteridine diphosphokinase [Oleiphilaceae bacterium]|nr:2-amino-4-hydroxy-6-hydroxymethyldihydropteridine diphosphokinase [Oleiphilaceae bacterium]